MPRAFLIDTDTASDDAVAIIMALRWPDVEVKAITTVVGNMTLEQGTRNALYTAELCGSTVPVYAGAPKPLLREHIHAQWFHGKDGLGDQGYLPPKGQAQAMHAVEAIIQVTKANPGIVWVTLGPLTNIALAIVQAPEIIPLVSRCVVMGGAACTVGNVTPAAEYNIWCDPEAAQMVFTSGLAVEMVGWELCRNDANLRPTDIDHIRTFGNPLADFTIDSNAVAMQANFKQSGEIGIALPDPVCMAVALDPDTVVTRMSEHYVQVECDSDLTRGMTVVDQLGVTNDHFNPAWATLHKNHAPKVKVCWGIDIPRWKAMLYQTIK
jgi:purine nucleosidase